MWVWLLFVFIPPLALGPIRIRDAGWAIGRWPKKLSPPESQVSNVTGDCNALKKTLMKYSSLRGLKGYLSRSLLASLKRAWWLLKAAKVMKMFPQKSISHPRTPPDPGRGRGHTKPPEIVGLTHVGWSQLGLSVWWGCLFVGFCLR